MYTVSARRRSSQMISGKNEPENIGNKRRVLVSELAGQSNLLAKMEELEIDLSLDREKAREVITRIKEREFQGYQVQIDSTRCDACLWS